nr:MAG TPA: hypothetical protein [Caudoviricetes sp.]
MLRAGYIDNGFAQSLYRDIHCLTSAPHQKRNIAQPVRAVAL